MKRALSLLLVLAALPACGSTSSQASPAASATDAPTAAPAASATNAPAGANTAPAAAQPACAADAYKNASPAFCVNLPSEVRGKTPLPSGPQPGAATGPDAPPEGVLFSAEKATLSLQWLPRTSSRAAEWKTPKPVRDKGTFKVLATEALPGGSYFLVYDATQSSMNEIYHVPAVYGIAVIDGPTHTVRCSSMVHAEKTGDPEAIAKENAATLAACRSLHAQ